MSRRWLQWRRCRVQGVWIGSRAVGRTGMAKSTRQHRTSGDERRVWCGVHLGPRQMKFKLMAVKFVFASFTWWRSITARWCARRDTTICMRSLCGLRRSSPTGISFTRSCIRNLIFRMDEIKFINMTKDEFTATRITKIRMLTNWNLDEELMKLGTVVSDCHHLRKVSGKDSFPLWIMKRMNLAHFLHMSSLWREISSSRRHKKSFEILKDWDIMEDGWSASIKKLRSGVLWIKWRKTDSAVIKTQRKSSSFGSTKNHRYWCDGHHYDGLLEKADSHWPIRWGSPCVTMTHKSSHVR